MRKKEATERAESISLFRTILSEAHLNISEEQKKELESLLNELEEEEYKAIENAEQDARCEVDDAFGAIKDKILEPNYFNSIEWLNDFIDRMEHPSIESFLTDKLLTEGRIYPILDKDFDTEQESISFESIKSLKDKWESIFERYDIEKQYYNHYRFGNPIDYFVSNIYQGRYPPPEIVTMIAHCFTLYFKAEGKLSLEEVFFGKPKKRAGNYASRKSKHNNYVEFHFQVIHEKYHNKNFNLIDFALNYLKLSKEHDVESPITSTEDMIESYVTGYHRWKKANNISNK
jgi:hypothetical protein